MRIELIAFVTGAALACVIAPSVAQNTVVPVTIDNFVFEPERVTVKVGTTVTWTNHDDIPHTVASKDRAFKSKVMDTDESIRSHSRHRASIAIFAPCIRTWWEPSLSRGRRGAALRNDAGGASPFEQGALRNGR